jgi:hypothetical protein
MHNIYRAQLPLLIKLDSTSNNDNVVGEDVYTVDKRLNCFLFASVVYKFYDVFHEKNLNEVITLRNS